MENGINYVEAVARRTLKPPDDRPPWEWIEQNIRIRNSPYGDRPNFAVTPWLREPLQALSNNIVRMITCQCCVQGGKSFLMQTGGIWALCEDPGPLVFYAQTNEQIKRFAESRWLPSVEGCEPLKQFLRANRHSKRTLEINFSHTFAYLMAANESNAQSVSARYVFCDEAAIYDPGILLECHKRATQWWNRRIVNGSTPEDSDTDFDNCFEAGDKREWALCCPECRKLQIPGWKKNIVWEQSDVTKPNGIWDFNEARKTVRFKCEFCGSLIPHTEKLMRFMNDHGAYIRTNNSAPQTQVSFRWNAICLSPSVLSWADLLEEFLKARNAQKDGYIIPLREFFTKRMAEAWQPESHLDFAPLTSLQLPEPAKGEKHWEKQDHIFMSVDVQQDHFWVLVEAWSMDGDSMTLWAGKLQSWDEIQLKQEEYSVANENVGVDVGYNRAEVLAQCVMHGSIVLAPNQRKYWLSWKAFSGKDQDAFIYIPKAGPQRGTKIILPYVWPWPRVRADMGMRKDDPRRKQLAGKECVIVTWSAPWIKDIACARRDGRSKSGKDLIKAADWNEEYSRQMHSERKREVVDKMGQRRWRWEKYRDNHLFDCKCMVLVFAHMRQIIGERFSS